MEKSNSAVSLFELMGGEETVRQLVQAFYPIVVKNETIGPLFPKDVEPVMEKQILFLTQFFGGPPLYSEKFGHPMMRARHMPFSITPARAEAWLSCMESALKQCELSSELQQVILERLSGPAFHFVNN
jgi:hemoglobin